MFKHRRLVLIWISHCQKSNESDVEETFPEGDAAKIHQISVKLFLSMECCSTANSKVKMIVKQELHRSNIR